MRHQRRGGLLAERRAIANVAIVHVNDSSHDARPTARRGIRVNLFCSGRSSPEARPAKLDFHPSLSTQRTHVTARN